VAHLSRPVLLPSGPVTVWELLRQINYSNLIKELPVRVTPDGLIQLVYLKELGSQLVRWSFR
jgi:hypothetical protein